MVPSRPLIVRWLVRRLICWAVIPALLLAGWRGSPRAAPRLDPTERKVAAAQFKKGKALYAWGDYEGALTAFRAGFETYPLLGFLINIGQCHRKLDQLDEAARAYRQFLEGRDVKPALRREVEDALAEVERLRGPAPSAAAAPATGTERGGGASQASEEERPPGVHPESPAVELTERPAPATKKRSRAWVWGLVGVGVAAVATGVAVGVVFGLRANEPSGGTLGIVDGRTP